MRQANDLIGRTTELTFSVEHEFTADRHGNPGLNVLATPSLVEFVERTAARVLEPLLEPGERSVGTAVHILHLAPTPEGARVRVRATIQRIEGQRIDFDVAVSDEKALVGKGSHERVVVDSLRFLRRVERP